MNIIEISFVLCALFNFIYSTHLVMKYSPIPNSLSALIEILIYTGFGWFGTIVLIWQTIKNMKEKTARKKQR